MERPSKLQKQYVLEWFGGKEEYIKFHRMNHSFHEIKKYIIEEWDFPSFRNLESLNTPRKSKLIYARQPQYPDSF